MTMILIIPIAALAASFLTFFSGFGLGTILMPVFILFFPIDTAIALTAIVHFLNNILKVSLLWKDATWKVVLKFGL
ncbi:MAG: TSUP family transporter, partial [Elusimicrobiales bacterium]|nr:TSUP family transporter [Elusimicrobiales bacterium]